MNDEGNVVIETVQEATTQPTNNQSSSYTGDTTNVIVNTIQNESNAQPQQITEPIGETTAQDILPTQETIPPSEPTPEPIIGSPTDDVQIIEMMSQMARSTIYNQQELNEANLDSQLATAIAYNESKNRKLAIDEYHLKRQQAIYEAEHTGYYLSPEDKDMVTQMNMAEYVLKQPNITKAQKTKAQKTIATVQNYFKSKGISTKGIETLDKIIKEKELDLLRRQNLIASIELQALIKRYEAGIIDAIYSALDTGDTPEQILARYSHVMDPQDILTIIESYDKSLGKDSRIYNKIENLTDKEFKLYTKETGYTIDGKKIYEFKYQGKTAYIYEDTIENVNGEKEKVYKQIEGTEGITSLDGLNNYLRELDKEKNRSVTPGSSKPIKGSLGILDYLGNVTGFNNLMRAIRILKQKPD